MKIQKCHLQYFGVTMNCCYVTDDKVKYLPQVAISGFKVPCMLSASCLICKRQTPTIHVRTSGVDKGPWGPGPPPMAGHNFFVKNRYWALSSFIWSAIKSSGISARFPRGDTPTPVKQGKWGEWGEGKGGERKKWEGRKEEKGKGGRESKVR